MLPRSYATRLFVVIAEYSRSLIYLVSAYINENNWTCNTMSSRDLLAKKTQVIELANHIRPIITIDKYKGICLMPSYSVGIIVLNK